MTDTTSRARLGPKLRRYRRLRELTLSELATRAGCSESMLSKIETQRVNPSLTLLRRLAAALDLNVATLFDEAGAGEVVSRCGQRPRLDDDALRSGDGVILERLVAHDAATMLQGNIHIVLPGGASDGLIAHVGEEMGYLLEGRLELVVDGKTWVLEPGDSFHFRSELPHGYRNPGDSVARVLWVNTPPTF
ncbi:MAG: XRE family transcriptional regulator [Pseudomonadota bacterium]